MFNLFKPVAKWGAKQLKNPLAVFVGGTVVGDYIDVGVSKDNRVDPSTLPQYSQGGSQGEEQPKENYLPLILIGFLAVILLGKR